MRVLLATLLTTALLAACGKTEAPPEPVRAVRTLTVVESGAALQQEYPAEVRARAESRPGFRVAGKLLQRFVDVGSEVKAGQPLAQIDASDFQLGQQAAAAAVRAAEAQLAINEADYKRYTTLRDQGFISGAELERREATLKASRAQAEQAIAQARLQGNQAGYAVLTAQVAGVVTAVEAEPGTVLAAGTPVLRLAHDGPRDAVFTVPEDQVGAIRALLGKPGGVKLRPWGEEGATPATVREVAAAADPLTRTFTVRADIGRTGLPLGRTATVLVPEEKIEGIVKLPLPAVFEQGGKTVVWVLEKPAMTVRIQPIQVAGADGNLALVAAGLQPGQTVVTAGVHVLTPGQKVRFYVEPGQPQPAGAGPGGPSGAAATGAPAAAAASQAASR